MLLYCRRIVCSLNSLISYAWVLGIRRTSYILFVRFFFYSDSWLQRCHLIVVYSIVTPWPVRLTQRHITVYNIYIYVSIHTHILLSRTNDDVLTTKRSSVKIITTIKKRDTYLQPTRRDDRSPVTLVYKILSPESDVGT